MSDEGNGSQFHRMPRGDLLYILALLLAATLVFTAGWNGAPIGGMALLGWLLAGLMVLSPTLALARLLRGAGGAGEADGR